MIKQEKDWIKSADLSAHMEVSVRSIKNYVKEINSIHKDLIQSSKNGYSVDKTRAGGLLADDKTRPPSTPE